MSQAYKYLYVYSQKLENFSYRLPVTLVLSISGCCYEYCKENYHFPYGILRAQATFKEDKCMYCKTHAKYWDVKDKPDQKSFETQRTVHVDTENEKMKKTAKQIVDLRTVQVTIGSLTIDSLGDQVKPKISDTKEALIPIGYSCSRYLLCFTHFQYQALESKIRKRTVM